MSEDDLRRNQEMEPLDESDAESDRQSSDPKYGTSPIRPQNPDPPRPRVTPGLTRPTLPGMPSPFDSQRSGQPTNNTPSQTVKVEEALEALRQKMTSVTQEYAEGKINQAQFHAIYRRYAEQREITERLIERNPETGAWQSVMQPGHTSFLRDKFAAKIISYAIYRLENGDQVALQGKVRLPGQQLLPIIQKLNRLANEGRTAQPAWRKLKDGSWVVLVPGRYTVSVVIFSIEPAISQRERILDVQRDFERANEKLLARGNFDPAHLVFPHRSLFA